MNNNTYQTNIDIESFYSSDEEDNDDELIRVTNKTAVTSGLEKALSISIEQYHDNIFENNSSIEKSYTNGFRIKSEFVTLKNGDRMFFGGKTVNFPSDFKKWSKNTQDNWKKAVRHEALRPIYISNLKKTK